MSFIFAVLTAVSCLIAPTLPAECGGVVPPAPALSTHAATTPERTGASLDVILSADAALVWDYDTDAVLYEKNANKPRQIASINKLLSILVIRDKLPMAQEVEIPASVKQAQRAGADIQLPVGQHATVENLIAASLIASANDAVVTLAEAASGSEDNFAIEMNRYAATHGMMNTVAANATGLSGGTQHSTAMDVKKMLSRAYAEPALRGYFTQPTGTLVTTEGVKRTYESTDKLLQSYLPILAAKTGFTNEAGENLAIITQGAEGHRIGAVILGSRDRFQDMKVLVEWTWRNFTWKREQ